MDRWEDGDGQIIKKRERAKEGRGRREIRDREELRDNMKRPVRKTEM